MPLDQEHVRAVADRVAKSSGLEIVDLEFLGVGKGRVLRVYIEKDADGRRALEQQLAAAKEAGEKVPAPENWDRLAGVTHEDCATFSRELGTILDVEDAVPGGEYVLEVSSPGLDRKLVTPQDYERFTGSRVKLMTREPIAGNRHFEGRLHVHEAGRIRLELNTASKKSKGKKKNKGIAAEPAASEVEIELANIEKARLVPEF
jgi:ribosome maturation factor RimP